MHYVVWCYFFLSLSNMGCPLNKLYRFIYFISFSSCAINWTILIFHPPHRSSLHGLLREIFTFHTDICRAVCCVMYVISYCSFCMRFLLCVSYVMCFALCSSPLSVVGRKADCASTSIINTWIITTTTTTNTTIEERLL